MPFSPPALRQGYSTVRTLLSGHSDLGKQMETLVSSYFLTEQRTEGFTPLNLLAMLTGGLSALGAGGVTFNMTFKDFL